MTSNIQREQLQAQIWKIANEVRGSVDGWDFKQFVLGTLSKNFTNYYRKGDEGVDYANSPDSIITPEIKGDAVKTKDTSYIPVNLIYQSSIGCLNKNDDTNPQ